MEYYNNRLVFMIDFLNGLSNNAETCDFGMQDQKFSDLA